MWNSQKAHRRRDGARALNVGYHKATYTHSEYVILIAFPLQQWLHERAQLLRNTYIACLVHSK
jgi:hypothetical protein